MDTKPLPFLVKRTPSGNLPIYVHSTQKGLKVTRVRHVFGDAEHLAAEVERLCGVGPATFEHFKFLSDRVRKWFWAQTLSMWQLWA